MSPAGCLSFIVGQGMRFLTKLFAKGEDPVAVFEDSTLGRMQWSKDDEGWIGTHNGFRYALSYDRKAMPTPDLVSYAREVLGDPEWLTATLEAEKGSWMLKVPPNVREEVGRLRFGTLQFSIQRRGAYIIADVEGGAGERSWRIEYRDRKCDGLGFDT